MPKLFLHLLILLMTFQAVHSTSPEHRPQSLTMPFLTNADSIGWRLQHTGITINAVDIAAVDGNVAWMAGIAGRIIRTTDAGNTWTLINSGIIGLNDIYVFDAISESTAFASTSPGSATYIYRTTNAGTTWSQVFSQTNGFINGIKMFNRTLGIAIGDPVGGRWTVAKTRDGGTTWNRIATEPVQIGGEGGWNGGFATFDTTHIWFVSNLGRSYLSTDGGQTWSSGQCGAGMSIVWFNSPSLGLAVCGNAVYRSTDGGRNWVSTTNPTTSIKNGLTGALGTAEFWLVANAVFYSPDAGSTWTTSPPHGSNRSAGYISMVTLGSNVFAWATKATGIGDTVLHYRRMVTGVNDREVILPAQFSLGQNYPNPFNPSTTITYELPRKSFIRLKVFDLLGREVTVLVDREEDTGKHSVVLDTESLASGVYFYRLETVGTTLTKKMIVQK